jgi:hypothetical protein
MFKNAIKGTGYLGKNDIAHRQAASTETRLSLYKHNVLNVQKL